MNMRYCALVLSLVLPAFAQEGSTTRTYTFDGNGARQLSSESTAARGSSGQSVVNINGGLSPIEKVEERVLRDDARGRVVERIIRPFDANGQPGPPQKLQIEERKNPDGSRTIETQAFHGNLSGGYTLAEQTTAVARKSGNVETISTQVARPTLNGSVEVVERKQARIETLPNTVTQDVTVERIASNGAFQTAVRETKRTQTTDAKTTENTAQYIAGPTGALILNGQTVAETQKRPDGSELKQVTVYGMNAPGRPADSQPQLREQQIIEKRTHAGQTIETLSIRRPALDNPNNLGPIQKIAEKVCTGKCV